jgi:hypothetical protein
MNPTRSGAPSLPRLILHLEGAAVLAASVLFYFQQGGPWLLFVVLLFAPDLSMLGYLLNPRAGSVVYNAAHIYAWPIILAALGLLGGAPLLLQLALIWSAHIGMDRLLGFGLKYPTVFNDTHLQHV